jgi:Flp pilus assembly pilin Flp
MRRFLHDEDGLTTVEYALLVALLAVGSLLVWRTFGTITRNKVAAAGDAIELFPSG